MPEHLYAIVDTNWLRLWTISGIFATLSRDVDDYVDIVELVDAYTCRCAYAYARVYTRTMYNLDAQHKRIGKRVVGVGCEREVITKYRGGNKDARQLKKGIEIAVGTRPAKNRLAVSRAWSGVFMYSRRRLVEIEHLIVKTWTFIYIQRKERNDDDDDEEKKGRRSSVKERMESRSGIAVLRDVGLNLRISRI